MSRTPTKNIDYTSRDYDGFKELLITKLQEVMPEYTDTSETDAGIVILEALANGLDILSLYLDIAANDVLLPTTQSRNIASIIARCLGYYPYEQTTSKYQQVFVLSEASDEDLTIPMGTVVTTEGDEDIEPMKFETMYDLIIPAGAKGDEKDDEGNYKYSVEVDQGETINQDVLGTSSGAPLQQFNLSYSEALVDTLQLYVNEGNGEELWTKVDSFYDTDENSKVYIVSVDEFDTCTIQFGNGINGKIPISYADGIVATYRVGGGSASIVDAGAISVLEDGIAEVDSTFNLEVTTKGHDKETLESIKMNAPASFRAKNRLVTLEDYEDLLRINFYDFFDIKAVRDNTDLKLCHLFYIMKEGYTFTTDLASKVAEFISDRCMLGTTYDINSYTPQKVNIVATLYYDKNYDGDTLISNIKTYLEQVTFLFGEFSFGDSIIKSDLESEIKNMFDGIYSFRISSPTADIISPSAERNVLTLGTISITSHAL